MEPTREIKVLPGLEAIRRRPALYVGPIDAPDLTTRLLMQSLCHAVDEALSGRCSQATVSLNGAGAVVSYDAGMPLVPPSDAATDLVAERLLATISAHHNIQIHVHVGHELCEIGLAVLNGLCSDFSAHIVHHGVEAKYHYVHGLLHTGPNLEPSERPDETRLQFQLDASLLPGRTFDFAGVKEALEELESKLPALSCSLAT